MMRALDAHRITPKLPAGFLLRLIKGTRRLKPIVGFSMPMATVYLRTMFRHTSGLAVQGHKAMMLWSSAALWFLK